MKHFFEYFVIAVMVLMSLAIVAAGIYGRNERAKKAVELRPELMVLAHQDDGSIGLHMHVYLDRPLATSGMIQVHPNHTGHWRVSEINGFEAAPYLPSINPQPYLDEDPQKHEAWVENLSSKKRYRFDITILPTCKEARIADLLMFVTLPNKIEFVPAVEK